MQPEKKLNPFTPVSFQDQDDRPAQSKPKQLTPPPMLVPGQRYSGLSSSYLSKPSAIPADRGGKRLGERTALPTRAEGECATASPSLWQTPSFAPADNTSPESVAPPLWRERPQAQPAAAPLHGGFARPVSIAAAAEIPPAEQNPVAQGEPADFHRPAFLQNEPEETVLQPYLPNEEPVAPSPQPYAYNEEKEQPPAPEFPEGTQVEKPVGFTLPTFAPYADGASAAQLPSMYDEDESPSPDFMTDSDEPVYRFDDPAFPSEEVSAAEDELFLAPLQDADETKPPEYASYAHPLRGFGAPFFTEEEDVSLAAEKAEPAPEPSASEPIPEKTADALPRRRSRMQRRHDSEEDERGSEELISAAPHAYEEKTDAEAVSGQYPSYVPAFEQDTLPEIRDDLSYYWQGGYGQPQSPSHFDPVPGPAAPAAEDAGYSDPYVQPAETPPSDYGEDGSFDPYAAFPDFASVPEEDYADFYSRYTDNPPPPFAEADGFDPYAASDLPSEENGGYADFYSPPAAPMQPAFPENDCLNPYAIPEYDDAEEGDYEEPYVPPLAPDMAPGSFTAPMPPVQSGDVYREYEQMAKQAQAPLDARDGRTQPQPAYDPRMQHTQSGQAPVQPEKKPRSKMARPELVSLIAMIGIGIFLIILVTVVAIEFGKIFNSRDQSEAVWQQYNQTHEGAASQPHMMAELPEDGQTFAPAFTQPPVEANAALPLDDGGSDAFAASAQPTASTGNRTKITNYPDNYFAEVRYFTEDIKVNPAIKGMLSIPGVLNEYVVQAQEGESGSKYQYVDYRGGTSAGGAVYISGPRDLRKPPENIILRGSDAAEGKVFQPLWQYVVDNTFYNSAAHSFARLTTLYEESYYVLIAVVVADVSSAKEGYFDFSDKHSFASNNLMMKFVEEAKEKSIRDMDVEVLPNDRLMTLATVSTHQDGKCLVLLFRKVRDNEAHLVPVQAFPTPTPTPQPSETPAPEA